MRLCSLDWKAEIPKMQKGRYLRVLKGQGPKMDGNRCRPLNSALGREVRAKNKVLAAYFAQGEGPEGRVTREGFAPRAREDCSMLAQGTVCNRATFFGNGLQVVNCKGVAVVGRFPNDDSLALICSAKDIRFT